MERISSVVATLQPPSNQLNVFVTRSDGSLRCNNSNGKKDMPMTDPNKMKSLDDISMTNLVKYHHCEASRKISICTLR